MQVAGAQSEAPLGDERQHGCSPSLRADEKLIADQSFPAVLNNIFSVSCSIGVTRPIAPGNGSDSLAPLRIWTVPGALWGHLLWALRF